MKKHAKLLISLLLGAVLGYLLYYYFFMDVVVLFFSSGFFYLAISIIVLLMSIVGCSALISMILQRRISRWMLALLMAAYIVAMLIILFARQSVGRIAVWNPLTGLSEMNDLEMLAESALNLILFIPAGFFLRNMKTNRAAILTLAVAIGIEVIQYVTMRGIFDTLDIILYVLGMAMGTIIFRKINLRVE